MTNPNTAPSAAQPYAIDGVVYAIARKDQREAYVMFDTPAQANGFVEYMRRFIEKPVPAQTGGEAVAPEAKPTDADLIEQFIAHNSQFHRSADHPAWLYCKDGDGGYTSLRGDLFAATLRTLTQGNQS